MPRSFVLSRSAITKFSDVTKVKMHEALTDCPENQLREISSEGSIAKHINQPEEFNGTEKITDIGAEIGDNFKVSVDISSNTDGLTDQIVLREKSKMQHSRAVKDLTAEARFKSNLLTPYPDRKTAVRCERVGSARDLSTDQSYLASRLPFRSKSVDYTAGLSKTEHKLRETDIWV